MRELILAMSMSLDAFVCGPEGENEWMFNGDPEAIAWKVAAISDASLHIMGGRSFSGMAGYWPTATGPFAAPMNQIPKAVFSKRGPAILAAAGSSAATSPSGPSQPHKAGWDQAYVASGDLVDEVARLKAENGKPIVAHGGASFARSLIAQDLVDQYMLMVFPVALGKGKPIFADVALPRRLTLVSATAFPRGSVGQVFRRA